MSTSTRGEQVACLPDQEVEAGAVVTCEQLTECARTALWDAEPPAIVGSTIHRYPTPEPSRPWSGAGGWIVVFDLAGGDRRATDISLVPACLDQFRRAVSS